MSWEEWGYPDNLDSSSPYRILMPLFWAMEERGARMQAITRFESYDIRGVASYPKSMWYKLRLYMQDLDHALLRDHDSFIKPDFSGNMVIQNSNGSPEINQSMRFTLDDFSRLLGEEIIVANELRTKASIMQWCKQRYNMINLLRKRWSEITVIVDENSGGHGDSTGHASYQEAYDNAVADIGGFGSLPECYIGGSSSGYFCSVRMGIAYPVNISDLATLDELHIWMSRAGDDFYNPFYYEGLNIFSVKNSGTVMINGYTCINQQLSSNEIPPLPPLKQNSSGYYYGSMGVSISKSVLSYYPQYEFVSVDNA